MTISTPSTPSVQQKCVTPAGPQRTNRFISHNQNESEALSTSPPRSVTFPIAATPIRPATRVPLRPISTHRSGGPPSAKRLQIHSSDPENFDDRFEMVHRGFPTKNIIRPAQLTNTSRFLAGFIKTTETLSVFYESEPMEIEVSFGDSGKKLCFNDSMEVDAQDEDDIMEVDITDMEMIMDNAPMR